MSASGRFRVEPARLEGVRVITVPTLFRDHRGTYVETFNEVLYAQAGIDVHFVQDDVVLSGRHVLRGIHGDHRTWKLISCPFGELYLVVLDCRSATARFGQWQSFVLSDASPLQVLVPPGFGSGHLVLSHEALFAYKQSTYYDRASQFTVAWNDPRFAIDWPVRDPILSRRDAEVGGGNDV
jgi:dTDP-4-dehydrorhamnose 3,5-epimerase